jgi:TonB-linked SusC/RagA family outer membrane protein
MPHIPTVTLKIIYKKIIKTCKFMEKIKNQDGFNRLMKKLLLQMKLTLTIILFCLAGATASTYSQITRLDITLKEGNMVELIKQIEEKSEFFFYYQKEELKDLDNLNVEVKNATVMEILDQVTKGTSFDYTIIDRYIVVRKSGDGFGNDFLATVQKNIGAQQSSISGKVTDSNDQPLPGVTVLIKGTTQGTVTNADGDYLLTNIPDDATLVFSFVGMRTQEVIVGDQTRINIKMEEETIGIEEVVAIGYGTMKKSDLTGAVASVTGEKISEKVSSIVVSQALQGITPGLMVTRSGASDANAAATIRIRGITTIGDSNPLIIVDGIPVASLDRVNPNDIEDISVLKDAASSAIYGSRAAAGVIVVTTKRAKDGQLRMSYDYNYTFEQPTEMAEYTDAVGYMKIHNERSWNDVNNLAGQEHSVFSKDLIDNYASLHKEDPDNYPDTDWHDLMLKDWALKNRHTFSLSAGTKNIKSYVSINFDDTKGLFIGKDYDRFTIRANNDIYINQYFSADLNLNGFSSLETDPQSSQAGQAVIPGQIQAAIYPAEWSDGRIAPGKGGENNYAILKYAGSIDSKSTIFGGKFQLNFTPIDKLKFSAAYSAEQYNYKSKNHRRQLTFTNFDDPLTQAGLIRNAETTRLSESRNDRNSYTLQFLANYTESFNKHDISLMAGYEENSDFNESLGASRDEYALKNFPYLNLGNANYQFNSGSAWEYANRSVFGRVIYDFNDKYLLQSNLRYDGSSRFHQDYRWGLFPSISGGWVVSEENFMENINEISYLKVRASWGSLGNERIGTYPYQSTIGFNELILFMKNNVVAAQGAGVMDYTIPDISWETTDSFDFGVDLGFVDNKLRVTADYYKKTTRDMLLALEIPDFIGLNNPDQNTGNMYTNGWEFLVSWADKKGDFNYSVTAHLSDSKSIMGDLGGTEFIGSQVKFEGSEFNEWYGFKSDGLYQTQEEVDNSATLYANLRPGDVKFVDISGPDGVPDGKISHEYDRVLLGGSLPRYLYGGNIDMGYKNFNFSLVFQGVGKQNSYIPTDWVNPYYEAPSLIVGNSWSHYNTEEQNKNVKYPRLTNTNKNNNHAVSDFWLFNGAYFRLKNISLRYEIPQNLVSKLKLNSLSVNGNVSDLFSIDNYPEGWDPETTTNYWITRAFTLGVSVKF